MAFDVVTYILSKQYADSVISSLPSGFTYRGSVNYKNDLPGSATAGDVYTVVYDGESGTTPLGKNFAFGPDGDWIELATLAGPKGDKGDKGDRGLQGPQGIQGPKGDTGSQGIQGPKGDKGDKGDTGAQGIQGPIGPAGAKGAKGDKGDKGDTGAQGPAGQDGAQGIQGPQGPQGIQGPAGQDGAKGDKGDKGDPGDTTMGQTFTTDVAIGHLPAGTTINSTDDLRDLLYRILYAEQPVGTLYSFYKEAAEMPSGIDASWTQAVITDAVLTDGLEFTVEGGFKGFLCFGYNKSLGQLVHIYQNGHTADDYINDFFRSEVSYGGGTYYMYVASEKAILAHGDTFKLLWN